MQMRSRQAELTESSGCYTTDPKAPTPMSLLCNQRPRGGWYPVSGSSEASSSSVTRARLPSDLEPGGGSCQDHGGAVSLCGTRIVTEEFV